MQRALGFCQPVLWPCCHVTTCMHSTLGSSCRACSVGACWSLLHGGDNRAACCRSAASRWRDGVGEDDDGRRDLEERMEQASVGSLLLSLFINTVDWASGLVAAYVRGTYCVQGRLLCPRQLLPLSPALCSTACHSRVPPLGPTCPCAPLQCSRAGKAAGRRAALCRSPGGSSGCPGPAGPPCR